MQTVKHARSAAKLFTLAAALVALGLTASGVHAQTYTKTSYPGNVPPNAQNTYGTGALNTIVGSFTTTSTASTASNPDLYRIIITGTSPFSATTVGPDTTIFDTQLFLFDSTGAAVYANDDASDFTKGAFLNPVNPVAPGVYYLGVAAYGAIPRAGTGAAFDMFPNTYDDTTGDVGFTGLKTPTPGVTGPLTNWFLSGADVETGTYSIALTGTTYAVPEASTWVSFGASALLLLAVIARRRVKTAVSASA